jgi:hypothetical protein
MARVSATLPLNLVKLQGDQQTAIAGLLLACLYRCLRPVAPVRDRQSGV